MVKAKAGNDPITQSPKSERRFRIQEPESIPKDHPYDMGDTKTSNSWYGSRSTMYVP